MRTFLVPGLLSMMLLSLACGDGDGPGAGGPFYSVRVNGQAWPSDTAIAMAFGATSDTTLSVAAGRIVSATQEQDITVSLHGFSGTGQAVLGDSTMQGIGSFAILQFAGGVFVAAKVYRSLASAPGSITVTRVDRADSTVSGHFAFEAALSPDTAPHQHISGSFTLRLAFTPVFTVP